MSYSIQCTHCQAVLKSATPVPAGKSVKCPKCQRTFTTPEDKSATDKGYAVSCLHCKAVLRSQAPVPAGKSLTCPRCGKAFTTPAEAPPAPSTPAAPAAKEPAAAPGPKVPLNISIFTGDADAAIADLMAESGGAVPAAAAEKLDDDLITEEDEVHDSNPDTKKK